VADEPFLGELKLIAFTYNPQGWAQCNGQLLPINQNQALFSLLGTNYGGNGQTTFALPDLRGRVPIHMGSSFATIGQAFGEEAHTLTQQEMPTHLHSMTATNQNGNTPVPLNAMLAGSNNTYAPFGPPVALRPDVVGNAGGSQPHENRPPFTVLLWCIALQGIFPSRN
jgi:microcystin-dependent protein